MHMCGMANTPSGRANQYLDVATMTAQLLVCKGSENSCGRWRFFRVEFKSWKQGIFIFIIFDVALTFIGKKSNCAKALVSIGF